MGESRDPKKAKPKKAAAKGKAKAKAKSRSSNKGHDDDKSSGIDDGEPQGEFTTEDESGESE
eukprot:3687942-Karenia_brevis.AAC.1